MSSPFRIAFVGIDHPHGAGWRKVLLNLGDAARVTAIVPRFGGATASLEERHTGAARFESVEELINHGEFDGAIVCLPNDEYVIARAALAVLEGVAIPYEVLEETSLDQTLAALRDSAAPLL